MEQLRRKQLLSEEELGYDKEAKAHEEEQEESTFRGSPSVI
jgi:hypothetical protein